MADYEFNNTYQYVIGREEIHVQWLRDALIDLGADVPANPPALAVPEGKGVAGERAILEDDLRLRPGLRRQVARDAWPTCATRGTAACSTSSSARSSSRRASSSWPWPAATTSSAAGCPAPAPATASCPSAG